MKVLFRLLGYLLLAFLLYVVVVLVHGTFTDFQPPLTETLSNEGQEPSEQMTGDSILSFMIWNIGYSGLGAESDFFYDNGGMFLSKGKMVRPEEALVQKNFEGVLQYIESLSADFYLFQEVDRASKRSYYLNQFEGIAEELNGYEAVFAPNYKAPRVPLPILEPWKAYGAVHSGLATYSRLEATNHTRYQLPGAFPWPTRIFQLDRCAAVHEYQIADGKELMVVNVHNSAYDATGELKRQQMVFLKDFLLAAYEEGKYVVVGGDWNQCPPYFAFDTFMPGKTQGYSQFNIDPDFFPPQWTWVYDPLTPTNRKLKTTYQPGKSFETLIDFFLISPNLKALEVKGIPTGFAFSDHQPVYMKVELN